MIIHPISNQGPESVRSYYEKEAERIGSAYRGRLMLALLDCLEAAQHPPVWAFTAHTWILVFADRDDWQEPLVSVAVGDGGFPVRHRYRVSYALPDPWHFAKGFTNDPDEAARMVLEGLRRAERGKHRGAFNYFG